MKSNWRGVHKLAGRASGTLGLQAVMMARHKGHAEPSRLPAMLERQMQVRVATAEDAEAIGLVRVAAWRAAYRGFMPDAFLDSLDPGQNLEGLKTVLMSAEPPFQLQVAEKQGTVVAFTIHGPPRYVACPKTLELWALNVLPECWRQGVGRFLVRQVLNAARDAALTSVELWCIAGNAPALALYESMGFVPTGERRTTSGLTGHPLHEVAYAIAP